MQNINTLTEEQRSKIVSSVYSNPKKLMIATFIYGNKEATTEQIAQKMGLKPARISEYVKEMQENSILISRRESYFVYYSLTEFGKKLVTLFN